MNATNKNSYRKSKKFHCKYYHILYINKKNHINIKYNLQISI